MVSSPSISAYHKSYPVILPSSPCVRAIIGLYLALGRVCFIKYPVLVVIRSRYNSGSSCYRRSWLFEEINFPAGVHHITQYVRSPLAGHTFLGHARPRKINTSQPHLGTTERSARQSKSYGARVWAHRPLHNCMLRGRPEADLASLIQEQAFQSNPARAAQSLTSRRLRLIPRR